MSSLISVNNLTRRYGDFCAVNNISFELAAGDILGFLGPNGAGKSSTMQMLSGNLAPTFGEISINSIDLLENPKAAKASLGYLPENPPLYKEMTVNEYLQFCGRLHLIGLVSDGGVHSHQEHLIALAAEAKKAGVDDIMVHAITDGRDTSPTGGEKYLSHTEDKLAESGARIATVVGRYYAMDRDNRWERTKLGWDAIVNGVGEAHEELPSEAVASHYREDKTDEFMPAMVFGHADEQRVRDGDVVLFFNFRADRARQLSRAFLEDDFDGFDRGAQPKVHYVTLTEYDEKYSSPIVFPPERLKKVLGEVVGAAGKKQLRIAETEKYPHVTYFFNGGEEVAFPGEDRAIIPSPKVATYDLQPEMNADQVIAEVTSRLPDYDLVILNFANPDMVGHTGIVEAAIKACEKIDEGVRAVVEATLEAGGKLLITADHGNCEQMINADGSPHTAHTTNLVHLVYVAEDAADYTLEDGILADIAPTLLDMMGLEKPEQMTGTTRLKKA